MLKQVLFNHMLSRETEEGKEENKQSGAPECQSSASSPGSPEAASAAATQSPQRDDPQLPPGHSAMSDNSEPNGEEIITWVLCVIND